MIDYELKDLFYQQDIEKQLIIQYDTGTITNNEIHSESFTLEENLCSESNLRFGACEASSINFTVSNIFEALKNKWLDVSMTLAGEASKPFQIGRFKVYSDVPTADRTKRNVTAYDALYDIINADVATWYKNFFTSKVPEDEEETVTYTLKEFRDSFFEHFGITQEEISLINDEMTVEKTIQPEKLSGKTVISAICEINACFGHIGRNGNFQYVKLEPIEKGIYPSATLYPKKDLYPVVPSGFGIYTGTYISAQYEDFETELITKIQVRQEEDDIGAVSGDGDNSYVIQDNFLVYGKDAEELQAIADKILAEINGIYYKPFEAKCIGNPCLEVGDAIRLSTARASIHSYILQRKLTGVQALRDTYTADGEQEQSENVNSVSNSIVQLKGKTNTLTRTVDETILELEDLESDTNTRFEQTSEEILLIAERTTENEQAITSVSLTADGLSARIEEVDGKVTSLSVTSDEIKTSVSDLETSTNSKITQLSNEISLRVTSGEVQSMIDVSLDELVLTSEHIRLEGYTTINGGFSVDEHGSVTLKSGNTWAYLDSQGFYVMNTFIGNGVVWTGDVSCDTINNSKPITVGNLGDYIGGTSTIGYILSDLSEIWEQMNLRVTESDLESALSDYVTSSSLSSTLSSYVTSSSLTSTLSSYVKTSTLSSYAKKSDLSDYVTTSDFDDLSDDVAQNKKYISAVQTAIGQLTTRVSDLEDNESNYATTTGLNNAMSRIGSLESRVTALEAAI